MKNIHGSGHALSDIANDPFDFTFNEIAGAAGEHEAKSLYSLLYKSGALKKAHTIWIKETMGDADAKKYIFELYDDKCIETVCIKRKTGTTACVSSQAGCPVRCVFCESGRNGLARNLTASEMVQQIVFLKEPINRIVFMGMGEPLYNYDAVIKALRILRDRNGLDFPTDGVTISTVGPIRFLKKLREEHMKIQLVLSLHATDQKTRDRLMPGTSGYAINETIEAALSYSKRHNRKLTIAYLVSPGINDRHIDIKQLIKWFKHEHVMINLLEYNQTSRRIFKKAGGKDIERFKDSLESCGLEVNIRARRADKFKRTAVAQVVCFPGNSPAPFHTPLASR
ncbi:MAG: radical SAM protein [Treponema sp.]|nr:radical SAM protein [Treponema sp.]